MGSGRAIVRGRLRPPGRHRIGRGRRSTARAVAGLSGWSAQQERRDPVEGVVEDGLEAWPEPRVGDQLGRAAELRDRRAQQVDLGERVRLARQQQDRAADRRPVGDPGLGPLGRAGRVERVAEQDERRVRGVRFRGGQAGHPAAVRVPADDHVRRRRARPGGRPARRPRPCAWAGRSPSRSTPRAASPLTNGAMLAAVPRRPVPQIAAEIHHRQRSRGGPVDGTPRGPTGSWPSTDAPAILAPPRTRDPCRRSSIGAPSARARRSPTRRSARRAVRVGGAQPAHRQPTRRPRRRRRADRPDASSATERHVPRPRLRARRRDVAVRRARPRARRPDGRPRSSPTTTRARRSGTIAPTRRSGSASSHDFAAAATKPLVALRAARRRGASTASPTSSPTTPALGRSPRTTTAGGHGRPGGCKVTAAERDGPARRGDRPAFRLRGAATRPRSSRSARSPRTYDQYRGVAARRAPDDRPHRQRRQRAARSSATCAASSRPRCRRRWPTEALKAQAIAARSYAARRLRPGRVVLRRHRRHELAGLPRRRSARRRRRPRPSTRPAGVVLKSGSTIANTLFHSTGGGATEHNENVYVSVDRRRRSRARSATCAARPTGATDGTAYDDGVAVRDVEDRRPTRGASCRRGSPATPRTNVGDADGARPARPRRVGPAHQRHADRLDRHEDGLRRRVPGRLQRRAAGRRPDAPEHAVRHRAGPVSRVSSAMTDATARCCVGRRGRRRARPADGRLPRRRVGRARSTTTSSCSSGSRSSRSRPACRGRRSCASATAFRAAFRGLRSARSSPPSTTPTGRG